MATTFGDADHVLKRTNQTIRAALATGQERYGELLQNAAYDFNAFGDVIYKARNVLRRGLWQGTPVVVKRFKVYRGLRGLIYGQLRKSKARRSFENACRLIAGDIMTPQPIGYIEHLKGLALDESFYVSCEWPADFTIREPLQTTDFPGREELLSALGEFAWRLHQRNVYHRDFSPGNILVRKSGRIEPEFCLVDVNRIRFESMPLSLRMKNFAMLWAADHDLKTIVHAYTAKSGDPTEEAIVLACKFSRAHKARAVWKERIKAWLRLH